jgi:hypothetical protein
VSSLFCRHNRFTADCPICSKGTVFEKREKTAESRGAATTRTKAPRKAKEKASRSFAGPYVVAGPFDTDRGRYEVRLEQVPGGLRLAQWSGGALERKAPVIEPGALRSMLSEAGERGIIGWDDWGRIETSLDQGNGGGTSHAASSGRAGDMQEELRVERLEDGSVRIARWLYWPGASGGWQLQDAPLMYPAERYVQAFSEAAKSGLI